MRAYLAVLLAALAACGGSVQPRPLQYHVKAEHLASVDPEKQRDAVTAKGEYDMAMLQRNKLQSDLAQIDLELLKARNDVKSAQLQLDSARAEDKAAAATADTGRKQRSGEALELARLQHDVADARRAHVEARRKALEKQLRWAEFNVYAAEAKFELEKAGVAVNNSLSPDGFKYGDYDAQHKQRVAEAAQAKAEADEAQKLLETSRRALEDKEKQLGGARL